MTNNDEIVKQVLTMWAEEIIKTSQKIKDAFPNVDDTNIVRTHLYCILKMIYVCNDNIENARGYILQTMSACESDWKKSEEKKKLNPLD